MNYITGIFEIINKYMVYVYLLLVAVIVVCIINLLIKLLSLAKTANGAVGKLDGINTKVEHIQKDTEQINYTVKHSLPLFVGIISIWTVLKAIIKDYKKTDKSKRSIVNSSINTAIRKPATVSKAFSSIKNF